MNRLATLSLLAATLLVAHASAANAYLAAPGTGSLNPVASVQWAKDFWFDDNPATLPGHLTQTTMGVDGEYGLAPNFAADFSAGYSWVNYQGGNLGGIVLTRDGRETRAGTTDYRVGLSWRLLDEFESFAEAAPTVTVRLGGIIAGDYDTGFLNAVSDGADGVEAGVMFGKILLAHNAGIQGEFTYRWRSSSVPDEWEASFGAFKTVKGLTLSAGLRQKVAVGGIDILGPGFTLDRFTDVREKNLTAEVGVALKVVGDHSLRLGYARTLDGENTPKKNVVVVATTFSF